VIGGWNEDLTPEERDALIEKIADGVVKRGMATPAVLFLEMHKPLSFAASQSLIVTSPLIGPFVGVERLQAAAQVLKDRDNIERLICRIEDLAAAKQPAKGGASS
jgi:acyl-CoA reductase-like NAD-dependent aldehyde dehydrogenase